MPQFLSATTTSKSSNGTTATATESAGSPPTTLNKIDLSHQDNDEAQETHNHSYHLHSKSIRQHHVGNIEGGESSDGGGVHGEYSEDEGAENHKGHKNGYHLKISDLETVPRTPKEHFSDQVGKQRRRQ